MMKSHCNHVWERAVNKGDHSDAFEVIVCHCDVIDVTDTEHFMTLYGWHDSAMGVHL